MQAGLFENNNQVYIDCLVKFESPRHILTLAYSALVASKQIKSIESLPIEEKNKLWALTKEFAAGKLEKNKTLELSKALYTLEFYLQ
jgi:hypothetical protein